VPAKKHSHGHTVKYRGCLAQVFRLDVRMHSSVFLAVAVITQLAIENGEPLFALDYNDSI
jgi:hypothetical protein